MWYTVHCFCKQEGILPIVILCVCVISVAFVRNVLGCFQENYAAGEIIMFWIGANDLEENHVWRWDNGVLVPAEAQDWYNGSIPSKY